MPSKRRPTAVVDKDGISGIRGGSRELETPLLEIDSTFGRVLGLSDGQRVVPQNPLNTQITETGS